MTDSGDWFVDWLIDRPNERITKQEAFEKCWAHSPREPPHAHSAGVASGTVARRLRMDVHNDNAWQRGPMAMAPWNGPNYSSRSRSRRPLIADRPTRSVLAVREISAGRYLFTVYSSGCQVTARHQASFWYYVNNIGGSVNKLIQ